MQKWKKDHLCKRNQGQVLSLSPFLHPFTANQTWGPPPLWTPTSHIYCTSPRQMCPPMLCTPSVHTPTPSPFVLLFRSGNIRNISFGCRGSFSKQSCPPHDMVVQHKDYRKFVVDGVERQRFGNVYYHPKLSCIRSKQPAFNPTQLQVSQAAKEQATSLRNQYLQDMMGVCLF